MNHSAEYFGYKVTVFEVGGCYPGPFPWRFSIEGNGRKLGFSGMPNYCETKASALKRAWWRCKWLADGTFDKRYVR